jgi:type IV secretion system protein VirD4
VKSIVVLIAISGVVLIAVKWAFLPWIPYRRLPRHQIRHLRLRLWLRLHPGPGHATLAELWLRWGRLAAFRRGARTRHSLPFWPRAVAPASEYSILVGRAHYRHALRLPLDEHAVVKSPPRGGKTGWLARVILRYPGPVLSTTTKHDVFEVTSGVRARRGPVHVFNPQGVGNVPSTFRWNPLEGCQDPAVAIRRADAFANSVSQHGVEDASFWSAKASDYLRAYFHAAALAGLDLRHVARWVSGEHDQEPEDILCTTAGAATHFAAQLAEMRGEANRTISIGEDAPVAPLFACLTTEIHYMAALMGSLMPGGRLDPPLLMALDEVTQICPVPVPSWLADSGGKGIQIITVAHGEAQLRSRWGRDGARVIMDTSGAKIWLPGISDTETLMAASTLCGTAAVRERGQDHSSRHPVMTPEMIRQLPAGHALVVRGGHSPVIARLPMCWKDPLYRAARRHRQAIATLTPVRDQATAPSWRAWPELDSPAGGDLDEAFTPTGAGNGHHYPWDEEYP